MDLKFNSCRIHHSFFVFNPTVNPIRKGVKKHGIGDIQGVVVCPILIDHRMAYDRFSILKQLKWIYPSPHFQIM